MTSFRIIYKPESWNKLARKSYWTYKRVFEAWHALTWQALTEADIRKAEGAVRLVVTARWKGNRHHDLDNILLKPVIDTMVKFGVFPDDRLKNIPEITLRGLTNQEEDSLQIDLVPVVLGSKNGTDECSRA